MKKGNIILIGGGGHCKSCIDVIEAENRFNIYGVIDVEERIGEEILGYKIIGGDKDIERFANSGYNFLITLGHIKSNERRVLIFDLLKKFNAILPVIISPKAHVSGHAIIGQGTIIMHHVLINAASEIGENCIINSKALVEHDCKIGHQVHLAPGSILNGGVTVGAGSFIGSGSTVKQGITISDNQFIKANSLIKENI